MATKVTAPERHVEAPMTPGRSATRLPLIRRFGDPLDGLLGEDGERGRNCAVVASMSEHAVVNQRYCENGAGAGMDRGR